MSKINDVISGSFDYEICKKQVFRGALKSIAAIIENGQIINLSVANQMYPDARAFRNDIIGITTKEKSRRGGVGF